MLVRDEAMMATYFEDRFGRRCEEFMYPDELFVPLETTITYPKQGIIESTFSNNTKMDRG